MQELIRTGVSPKQAELGISVREKKEIIKQMSNRKASEPDRVQDYWLKDLVNVRIDAKLITVLSIDQVTSKLLIMDKTMLKYLKKIIQLTIAGRCFACCLCGNY